MIAAVPVFYRTTWEQYAMGRCACPAPGCLARRGEWCLDTFGAILEGVHPSRLAHAKALAL